MSDVAPQSNVQLGLLDLTVDLSVPEIYSGTEFTLYLYVKNPFSRPVWIRSVELSLPTQLSVQQSNGTVGAHSKKQRADEQLLRTLIRDRDADIRQLRQSLKNDNLDDNSKEKIQSTLYGLEEQIRTDLAGLSGGLVLNATGHADVHVNDARSPHFFLRATDDAIIHINAYQGMKEPERVPLVGSLPYGAALQPGSTDVWTIRLGSRRTPFFIPARYKLQLTVIYGLEAPADGEKDHRDLYSNTSSFTMQVRAALWSVILGGVIGGLVGSVARSLQGTEGAGVFVGAHANSTFGSLSLAAILSGAAVVFSARKAEAQSFVTVEDFWGGILIGFLIGYSGTAAFTKITGSQG